MWSVFKVLKNSCVLTTSITLEAAFKNRENYIIYNDIVCEKSVSVDFYCLKYISVLNKGKCYHGVYVQ